MQAITIAERLLGDSMGKVFIDIPADDMFRYASPPATEAHAKLRFPHLGGTHMAPSQIKDMLVYELKRHLHKF